MSNESPVEAPVQEPVSTPPKPKQYLLMADELHMAMLGKIMPGLQFVPVEGMAVQNNPNHMFLVNPVAAPVGTEAKAVG